MIAVATAKANITPLLGIQRVAEPATGEPETKQAATMTVSQLTVARSPMIHAVASDFVVVSRKLVVLAPMDQ